MCLYLKLACIVEVYKTSLDVFTIVSLSPSHSLFPPSFLSFQCNFPPATYHVVSATILSFNDTTVCLLCIFRHNSPSTGCYAVFHPINHTRRGVSYHKIMKSLLDTTASDCINTLPNGVYSVSVLDVLSYKEGRYNNTAVTISSLVTISTLLNPSTINGNLCVCVPFVCVCPLMCCLHVAYLISLIFHNNLANPSSSSYNPVSTSGPSVLIILSSIIPSVIIVAIVLIITVLLIRLCLAKKKKSNF